MLRWIGPLACGVLATIATYHFAVRYAPNVLMRAALNRIASRGSNRMTHARLADATARTIVRPSPDLAYSYCPYDVSKVPVLIDAVPVAAPYWSLSIFDSRTNTVFVRNGEQAQGSAFRVAVARFGQAVPLGYEVVRVRGARGIALIRILVADRAAFATLDRARRATTCRAR